MPSTPLTHLPAPSPVEVRTGLSAAEFRAVYVNRKPVLMRGAAADLPAVSRWSLEYFSSLAPGLTVRLKEGSVASGRTAEVKLADYHRAVADWEIQEAAPAGRGEQPGYLHDLPLLSMIPQLRDDLTAFPVELLPAFFRRRWWEFTQFFAGPARSATPLHFDSLLTHNIFFQIQGSKRFLLVDKDDRDCCYPYNWRWSPVDPEAPDLHRYPRFQVARRQSCLVQAGDVLYMPPGTLHQGTSLTSSFSFNIDWHDWRSALRGLAAVRHGMPLTNARYNLFFALGVVGRVPVSLLMPGLKSYLFYIS